MGRKSTRENKNIYQISRENLNYTREEAAEILDFISEDRIEKIEYGQSTPHPDEILAMAHCYKNPALCNYFCSHECEIGQKNIPETKEQELPSIILEMIATINVLEQERGKIIEICADGKITADEMRDFKRIHNELNNMSSSIDSLKLWIEKTISSGEIKESDLI